MNLKDYARSKGTNIKKIAEQIGVTPSTLYAISNGSTDFDHIGISLFSSIASALAVTTDELYSVLRFDDEVDESEVLSNDEKELIRYFRQLSPKAKRSMLLALNAYLEP